MPCTNAQQHSLGRFASAPPVAGDRIRARASAAGRGARAHPDVGRNNGNRAPTAERDRPATLFLELTRARDGPCPAACSRKQRRASSSSSTASDGCGRQSRVDARRFITVQITVSNSHHVASLRVEVVGVFTHRSAGRPLRSLDVASRVVAAVSADATPRHREPLRRLCQHSAAVTPAP